MKLLIGLAGMLAILAYSGTARALPVCVRATVSVGGGETSVQYYCTDGTIYEDGPPTGALLVNQGGDVAGGGGATGGRFNPYIVAVRAGGNCGDESSESQASNAFRVWKLATNPGKSVAMLAADNKFYQVTFSDGLSQVYKWGLALANTLPLQITNGSCQ